jgi:chemotaxis protein methyltransferase WspC
MALLEAGVADARFDIDAIDINAGAIASAERAEYGKNSFRGKDLDFRARYFQPKEKNWTLDERVRNRVRFQTGNMLDRECPVPGGAYDFIFCRNLLIYFDRPAQERVMRKLHDLLTAHGILFVGSAEAPIAARNGFVSAGLPLSFACRKAPAEKKSRLAAQPATGPVKESAATPTPTGRLPGAVSSADLARARRLADEGRLEETRRICETYLQAGGVSAEAYYLLGLVNDAAGAETLASEFYRKALYLEPNHYETLLQWASLSEKTGDGAHARILTKRAERIKCADLESC